MERQKVVVMQDASRDIDSSTLQFMRWALHGLPLNPGDMLTLLVLHQVTIPMGYKTKIDSSSMFGVNQTVVDSEIVRIKEEFKNHAEIGQISKLYQEQKVGFNMKVTIGPSRKIVATEAAIRLKATVVILDRQMKQDEKYLLENLQCGISRIKNNNTIQQLRGPKVPDIAEDFQQLRGPQVIDGVDKASSAQICSQSIIRLSFYEIILGSPEDEEYDLFSIELIPYCKNYRHNTL